MKMIEKYKIRAETLGLELEKFSDTCYQLSEKDGGIMEKKAVRFRTLHQFDQAIDQIGKMQSVPCSPPMSVEEQKEEETRLAAGFYDMRQNEQLLYMMNIEKKSLETAMKSIDWSE